MNPNDHIGNEYDAMTGDQKERHEAANSRCSASAGSDPRRDQPRFTAFEIAEYVCGWLMDGQCLHTVEDAEKAIGNALGQLRCGQDGLLASKQGRARNFFPQNNKVDNA